MTGIVQITQEIVTRNAASQRPGVGAISRDKNAQNREGLDQGKADAAVIYRSKLKDSLPV